MRVLLPLLIPLLTALITALTLSRPRLQRWLALTGTLLLLPAALWLLNGVAEAGRLGVVLGGWPAPYGIEMAADRLRGHPPEAPRFPQPLPETLHGKRCSTTTRAHQCCQA
jgi:formate hydrogenlyase subunit 3/multisubunit Na+/H+ antiporter MnhD subunit